MFVVHNDVSGNASEARFWISDKTGLPVNPKFTLSGSIVTDDFRYGDVKPPPGVN